MTSSGRQTCDLRHFQARAFVASKGPSRVLFLSDTEANNIPHAAAPSACILESGDMRQAPGPKKPR